MEENLVVGAFLAGVDIAGVAFLAVVGNLVGVACHGRAWVVDKAKKVLLARKNHCCIPVVENLVVGIPVVENLAEDKDRVVGDKVVELVACT